jgi:hypothetical protein
MAISASFIAELDIQTEKLALVTMSVVGHQLLAHLSTMVHPALAGRFL